MIRSIASDKPTFRKINFKDGFNVVLAERTEKSTRKDSRNGLGKSTLIEIIHFCLGGQKGETLKKQQMNDWTFTMEVDLDGKQFFINRNTKDESKITIEGDSSAWPIKPTIDETGKQTVSRNDWTRILGHLMFGLEPDPTSRYHPTFRSLISYFVRKNGQSGGFLNPFQQHKSQLGWDIQVNSSYLLELGWEYAGKLQILKDRRKMIDQIKQEAQTGIISNLMGNMGDLEAMKITLEDSVQREKMDLDNFKVHQQYGRIENDANKLTSTIHEKVNQSMVDKRLLEHYEASLKEEVGARPDQVARAYKEAGFIFPDKVTKKIYEVLEFHKKVVSNRKEFLKSELARLKLDIKKRDEEIKELTSEKSELMNTLKTHGSLDEYTKLQTNHQKTITTLNDISQRLANLKKFEEGKSSIRLELESLRKNTVLDLEERQLQKQEAILTFNSFSQSLYNAPGTLSINVLQTGYKFDVHIQRSGSHGIGNMKIFCYDLMLAKLWAKKTRSPSFLIHDSIIFADVDEKQKALALQLAESESRNSHFQYICTMNSDSIPRNDFDQDFDFDEFTVMTFTDVMKEDSLLGIRF